MLTSGIPDCCAMVGLDDSNIRERPSNTAFPEAKSRILKNEEEL